MHLKTGIVKGLAFGGRGLITGMASLLWEGPYNRDGFSFGGRGLITGMASLLRGQLNSILLYHWF